jgi:hypothetical protein
MILMFGGTDAHFMESIWEFGQANEAIIVGIKSFDEVYCVVL